MSLAPEDVRWTTQGQNVHFSLRFRNLEPTASFPTSGTLSSQPFGVFVPNHDVIGQFDVPSLAPDSFFDVEYDVPRSSLPPSATELVPGGGAGLITVGTETNSGCPPDDHWDGNVDIVWNDPTGIGNQVNYHFGNLQVCPGAGNSYLHFFSDCTDPAGMTWTVAGVCPDYAVTLVNEDFTPAPNPLPPGWSGHICTSALASVAIPDTCCFTVTFQCQGQSATIDVCATTCDCTSKQVPPEFTGVDWSTNPDGNSVHFGLRFSNTDPAAWSEPVNGGMASQVFGGFVPDFGPIGTFNVPSLAPDSFFDIEYDIPLSSLPPTATEVVPGGGSLVTIGTETNPGCPPDDHWDGNVDIVWQGAKAFGEVNKHYGTLQVCPGAGNSYIHVITACPAPNITTWNITGLCPGYAATLVEEDLTTPAPANLPPGWTGFICVSADPTVAIPDTCCIDLNLFCGGGGPAAVVELCLNTCDCTLKPVPPQLTTVDWDTNPDGQSVHFNVRFSNPDPAAPSEPVNGQMNSQAFGGFVPDFGPIGSFSVPSLAPDSFFDIEYDVSLADLPPTATEVLPGGAGGALVTIGTETNPGCPPDDHWDGNVDIVWQGAKAFGEVNKHYGTLQVCPGAGNSYIHVITACPPPNPTTWNITGLCPGYGATLVNEDLVTPAPALLPPGWTGFICVSADPTVAIPDTCCIALNLFCGGGGPAAVVELCVNTCNCTVKPIPPQLTHVGWTTNPDGQSVHFNLRFANPDPVGQSEPVSGQINSQPFGAFVPDFGPIGTFNVPPLAPDSFFDIVYDVALGDLPPTATEVLPGGGSLVTIGTETNPGCPPDDHWDGNVDIFWQGAKSLGEVNKHYGTLQVCPGGGNSYIHVITGCPAPDNTTWSISGLCPGYGATLVEEDLVTPAPANLPPGWTGFICVQATAAVTIPDTCCIQLNLTCGGGTTAVVELCVNTCDCTPKQVPPQLTDVDWSTNPGGQSVHFNLRFSNPDPVASSEAVSGVMSSQAFGAFLPDFGQIGTFDVPTLAPDSFFDIVYDVALGDLPPTATEVLPGGGAPLVTIGTETNPGCPPDDHWDGNVDIFWQGVKSLGEVNKHYGTLQVCPGAGNSYIHVITGCPAPNNTTWNITGLCAGYSATLVNEDLTTPAPMLLPPGWSGFICVSADPTVAIPDTCCIDLNLTCGGGTTAVVELCVNTCDCTPKPVPPQLTTVDWTTNPGGQSVHFNLRFSNPDPAVSSEAVSGHINSQPYGAFVPDFGPIGAFSVPSLAPDSFFDIEYDVSLSNLPPRAETRLPGGGPVLGDPNCPPDSTWHGNVDVVWQGDKTMGEVNKHFGTLLSCPGAGPSYIHVVTACPAPGGVTWAINGLCPGFSATLVENDQITPAPAVLPSGWDGWICVETDPSVVAGTACCISLDMVCGGGTAKVELCVTACYWQNVGVPPTAGMDFGIYNAVPNPTTGTTIFAFAMPRTGPAKLEIFDASGQRVRTVLDGNASAGLNSVTWDGRDGSGRLVPPGTYFARFAADGRAMGRKIMMVR